MSKSKKHPKDMTNEELAKKVFPKKVIDELKRVAHEKDNKGKESS
jgi:hypothetical protein